MAVTELALLRIKSFHTVDPVSSTILSDLKSAAEAQATFSNFPVIILQCFEDPTFIYLVGGWSSPSHHLNDWIPSPQNQELMTKLNQTMDVLWMFHLDIDPSVVVDVISKKRDASLDDSGVVAIVRYFVEKDTREAFSKIWDDSVDALEIALGEGNRSFGAKRLVKGWAVDYGVYVSEDPGREEASILSKPEGGESPYEEFVLFTAWSSSDRHKEFAKLDAVMRNDQVHQCLAGMVIKHAQVLLKLE